MNKKLLDLFFALPAYFTGRILNKVRSHGIHNYPRIRRSLSKAGIFPIRDHYYEPLITTDTLTDSILTDRVIPGIKLNDQDQLAFLNSLEYGHEIAAFPIENNGNGFYLNNKNFEAGDADIWFNIVRSIKPSRIYEVGSGYSTLLAQAAIQSNQKDHPDYRCEHVCVEPYEMPWLDKTCAKIIRKKIEDIPVDFFATLQAGDILFIDSSHMIRPQGDVLHIYLKILPIIAPGVLVHIHDIFTPRDYPRSWIVDEMKFWNEQYLLESILANSDMWHVSAALNYLKHNYFSQLMQRCFFLNNTSEPGSFYITRK